MSIFSKLLSVFSYKRVNVPDKTTENGNVESNQNKNEIIEQYLLKTDFMPRKTVITKVHDVETSDAIIEFPQNRALIVEQLSYNPPAKAEIVKNVRTMEDVFNHFKPNVNLEFEDMMGQTKKETMSFNELRSCNEIK